MMTLMVIRIDDELGVILPEEAIRALGIKEGDQLILADSPDGQGFSLFKPDIKQPTFGE